MSTFYRHAVKYGFIKKLFKYKGNVTFSNIKKYIRGIFSLKKF